MHERLAVGYQLVFPKVGLMATCHWALIGPQTHMPSLVVVPVPDH